MYFVLIHTFLPTAKMIQSLSDIHVYTNKSIKNASKMYRCKYFIAIKQNNLLNFRFEILYNLLNFRWKIFTIYSISGKKYFISRRSTTYFDTLNKTSLCSSVVKFVNYITQKTTTMYHANFIAIRNKTCCCIYSITMEKKKRLTRRAIKLRQMSHQPHRVNSGWYKREQWLDMKMIGHKNDQKHKRYGKGGGMP